MEAIFFHCMILLLGVSVEGFHHRHHHHDKLPKSLFVFGDSNVDTGNTQGSSWSFPYGVTFPGKPSGRLSDGRVLTDFLAAYLGIPSPVPYRERRTAGSRDRYGMNFAYSGAGVFSTYSAGLPNITTQIDYFERLLRQGTYSRQQLYMSMALLSVGGNDYAAYLLKNGLHFQALRGFIKLVVKQIAEDLNRLRVMGLGKIAVTGLEEVGCLPVVTVLTNRTSCFQPFNEDAAYHNRLLRNAVNAINARPGPSSSAALVVLPLYDAFHLILSGHTKLGSRFENPLQQCCVGVNGSECGSIEQHVKPSYTLCEDPSKAFFWDRVHLSQAGWAAVFQFLQPTLQRFLS
ncbi:GDSL esterase/lipase At3g09930-like [Nymphaea colorata]|nr:GDSL esterase/lipase At3g09930-like [Nymphaea colorata]